MTRSLMALLCSAVLLGAADSRPAEPLRDTSFVDRGEGRQLVNELLARLPAGETQVLGLLKIRAPDGPIAEIPIKWMVRMLENGWQDTYETQPAAGHPGEVLIVKHHGTAPSEYFFGRFQKPGEKVELPQVRGGDLFQPLAGSDFYLADLGLEFLHWPEQKIVKKEMRKSRSCRVVESKAPNASDSVYSRVLSWIDFETGNLIMAEAYDSKDRLLKEFSIRKISRAEGKAQLKEIEMRNDQTESRTRLEFNLEIPDEAAN